jgi:TP901 family phage tail tape measure protein
MAVLKARFQAIDEMSAMLDSISRAGESAIGHLERLGQVADRSVSTATASVGKAAEAFSNYDSETLEAINVSEDFAAASRGAEEALARQARAAEQAADEVEQFAEGTEDAGRSAQNFGTNSVSALQELSKALTAAGIAKALHEIYEGFAAAVGGAIEFESAITGVYKTVDGSSEQLTQISRDIKEMSTVMPASAIEISSVAEAAGQLGIATDDVTSFTRVMIDLGEATNLTADSAASALAKFTNITGMSAAHYEALGSTVVALGNNFATTEADIVAMSTGMASAGTLAGFTEAEILALATAMSSVGIEAAAGSSSMSKLITDMQVAVETGSDRLEEFASVAGMTGDQFAEAFGNQASDALYAFIDGLNDVERNGATATVVLENMGITEVRLSNTVKALANNSDGLSSALAISNMAWEENTALTAEAGLRYGTLESKLGMARNAANNFAVAVGDDLSPIMSEFVEAGTDALAWLTDFVDENPAVTAALSGLIVGITTIGGALAVYTTAQQVATAGTVAHTIAQAALNVVMKANPVFLIITGVVALTAAVATFVAILSSQKNEYETWTSGTRKQYDELQQLNSEYETACEQYGETSGEARALRYRVDELTTSFEANKQTLEAFIAETDALIENHQRALDSYEKNTTAIRQEELSALALVTKLEELSAKTSLTTAEQEKMKVIVDSLAESMPELALSYDEATSSINMTADALERAVKAQAEQELQAENYQAWVDLARQELLLEEQLAQAAENLAHRRQELTDEGYWVDAPLIGWSTDLDDYQKEVERLTEEYNNNAVALAETSAKAEAYQGQLEELANAQKTYGEAISAALNGVRGEMDELIAKYDESYEAARQNIDSVIGLFDTMKTETSLSISDMTAAMESQVAYLDRYTENLRKASEFGLDTGLITSLSDGSAESAGQLDAIIGKIENLGATTEDAAGFVSDFNAAFAEVETAKDEFAATVADMQTDFSTKMDEMEQKLTESIENMNMETEAATAAKDTMTAYINSIKAQQEDAVTAAKAVANATAAALSGTATVPSRGYAAGTTSAAPGLALVGEEGPELINFRGGEIVYTAPETERILSDSAARPFNVPVPESMERSSEKNEMTLNHKHSFEINGRGEIETGSGVNKEAVVDILFTNMKPVLMNILKTESFEEGDLAYEF